MAGRGNILSGHFNGMHVFAKAIYIFWIKLQAYGYIVIIIYNNKTMQTFSLHNIQESLKLYKIKDIDGFIKFVTLPFMSHAMHVYVM